MRQILIVLTIGVLGFSIQILAEPECPHRLLQWADSVCYTFNFDETKHDPSLSRESKAVRAVSTLLAENGCEPKDSMTNIRVECHVFSPRHHALTSCFVQTDQLYYFVTEDYVDGVNVAVAGRYD